MLNAPENISGRSRSKPSDPTAALISLASTNEVDFRQLLDALPAAIYTTDAHGRITHFNPACVTFSGRTPEIGSDYWCVTWKLFYPDGRPMPHDECPMAIALKAGRVIRGAEAIAERPDGTRVWFTPYPTPLFDDKGNIIGGINMLVDITDRKHAELAKAKLAAIVESSDDAIISKDLNGIIMSWNNGAHRLFGYTAEEVIGKPITILIPPDHLDEEPEILDRIGRGQRIDHYETVRQRKHGSLIDISLTVSPIKDADGRVIGAAKVARDITERKRAEQAITKLNGQLTADLNGMRRLHEIGVRLAHQDDLPMLLGEILDAAIEITRADLGYIQLVDKSSGILRIVAQRGFAQEFLDFFNSVHNGVAACGTAMRRGQRVIVEDVANDPVFKDTPACNVMLRAGVLAVQSTPLVARSGEILGMFSTHYRSPRRPDERDLQRLDLLGRQASDLIERKQAEILLRSSEERFRTLFDLGPVAVYSCDVSGVIREFNRRAAELWGRAPAIGDTDERFCGSFKMIRPDGSVVAHEQCPMVEVLCGKIPQARDAEVSIERPDGSRVSVIINILPLKDERGEITGAINCFYDITERKQAEDRLREAKREAEAASSAKDRFLAVLSHELRMPLTPVLMSVVSMDMNPDLAPDIRDNVAMIRRNVELEAKLIDDLLDLSRVTAGKLRLQMEAVDVNSAVRHVCETCRPLILEKGIHLHCDLPGATMHVKADAARLQQVLWNLVKNAAKFTPERGDIYVTVSKAGEDQVRLQVRDTGIGIAPDILPRIFDAFEQGDANITRQFGGMGLGLAISKALVEMHGGTIHAESGGMRRGSTFTVDLPAVSPTADAQPIPARRDNGNGQAALRVLIVEDHADTAEVLRRLLNAFGYRVKTAGSASAALELASKEPFDVIVSDIGLPDSTGYDLMKQIQVLYPMKGIAMSGYGMEEDLRKSREAGFSDHIVKPANVAQLDRAIRRVVGGNE